MRLIILILISFFNINACEDTDPSMCSEEEASVLVNKFTKAHFRVGFDDVRACYQPEFRKETDGFYLYLRESDCLGRSRVDRDLYGRPIVFFPLDEEDAMVRLHDSFVWRYFEEDLFKYITSPGFHNFPGLPFVLGLARKKVDDAISSLNDSCGLLPPPYNEKIDLDSTSHGFPGLFKLYLEVSSYNGAKISSIAKVIKGLHDFCVAKEDIEVRLKHKEFVALLEESLVILQERRYSTYLRQIVGIYKTAAAGLGDLGLEFRKELQSSSVASSVNTYRKIENGGMDSLLKSFRSLLLKPYVNSSGDLPIRTTHSSGTTFEDVSGIDDVMGIIASFCSLKDLGRLSFTCPKMSVFCREFFAGGRSSYELFADSGVTYPNFQRLFTLGDDRYLYGKLSSVSLWLYVYKEYLRLIRVSHLVEYEAKFHNQVDAGFVKGAVIAMKKLQKSGFFDDPVLDEKNTTTGDAVAEMLGDNDDEEKADNRSEVAAKIIPVFRSALLG